MYLYTSRWRPDTSDILNLIDKFIGNFVYLWMNLSDFH